MKRNSFYLYLLLFVFAHLTIDAQNQKQIDSINILLELSKKNVYSDTKKALDYAQVAKKLFKKEYGEKLNAQIEYRIGSVHYVCAVYDLALEHFLNATEIYKKINDSEGLAIGYSGLGLVEMGIENYESSIDYYKIAATYIDNKNDKIQTVIDFNMGLNYFDLEEYDLAIEKLWKSSKSAPIHGRYDIEQMAFINLGDYYLKIKKYDSAIIYYQKVQNHSQEVNIWQKTYLKRGLAKYYLAQKNLELAEKFASESLEHAKNIDSKWEISRNLNTLSEIAFKKNLFKDAYLLKQEQQVYNDSINFESRINKIKYLIFKKKETELHELAHQHENTKSDLTTAIWVLIITIFLFALSLILLFLFSKRLKKKKKSNKELDAKNNGLEENLATKTKILSIISHDMKSPLAAIKQVLMMYNNELLTREEQDSLLKKLLIQVESTIEMLNNLVFWAKKQAQGIKVNKVAINAYKSVNEIINHNKVILELKNIDVHLVAEDFKHIKVIIDPDQFQIICQNLLGNSIKYSHNSNEIHIRFSENDKMLKIHFIDFGLGMDAAKIEEILSKSTNIKSKTGTNEEKGSGLGLILVQSLLELNDGFLEIKSEVNKGSEIIINLVKAI
uniref:tetratricopeptide repeat-containing sensor histidine kinase n=2 Tax=Flavobacterium sp. TaxID=239 RepID=UPI00404A6F91